jgi:TonB family protein
MRKIKSLTFLSVVLALAAIAVIGQQTEREQYLELYKQGEYEKAITVLRRVTKKNSSDGEALHYLGLCYVNLDRSKEAIKPLEKAVELLPTDAGIRTSLAYAYMMLNDNRATDAANEALKLNPKVATAHYVLGIVAVRAGSYEEAFDRATKATEVDPEFTIGYLLRTQASLGKFSKATPGETRQKRASMLRDAAGDMDKFVARSTGRSDIAQYQEQLAAMKFFAEWYERPRQDNRESAINDASSSGFKIISKEAGSYTKEAKVALVSGVIRVLVAFGADGTIKHVLVIRPLGFGLDETTVKAAKNIKFEPAMREGKPVDAVKLLEYSFEID